MNALKIVRALLLSDADITGLVASRIFAIHAPQESAFVRPQIVLHLIDNMDTVTLLGAGKYYRSIIQTDCNGDDAQQAIDLGDAVENCLNGVIKATVGGAKDVDVLLEETDFTEFDDLAKVDRRVMRYSVRWRRAA